MIDPNAPTAPPDAALCATLQSNYTEMRTLCLYGRQTACEVAATTIQVGAASNCSIFTEPNRCAFYSENLSKYRSDCILNAPLDPNTDACAVQALIETYGQQNNCTP